MISLSKILKPGGQSGWSAADFSPEGVFGVSISPPSVPGAKVVVEKCAAVPDGALDVASVEKLARSIAVSGSSWVVPLNRKVYSILVVPEPAVKADEMDQSVRWGIGNMLDYPVADAEISWMKIPTQQFQANRPPHIYVMAARRETIAEHVSVFKQARLPLLAVDVRETAYRNLASLAAQQGEGVALLSVSRHGVQLVITFKGELYLDRYVEETGFADNVDAAVQERARERVVLQVQRSLDFVSRTLPFIDIARVLLAPMPEGLDLHDYIAQSLPLPVEPYDLSKVFDISRTATLASQSNQANYFVALGSALRFAGKVA